MVYLNITLNNLHCTGVATIDTDIPIRSQLVNSAELAGFDTKNIEFDINGEVIDSFDYSKINNSECVIVNVFNVYPLDSEMKEYLLSQKIDPSKYFSTDTTGYLVRHINSVFENGNNDYIRSKYFT